MAVVRFSATKIFGAPIDGPNRVPDSREVMTLLTQYDAERTFVTDTGPTDITPPYWTTSLFRYFLTVPNENEAHLDLMPTTDDAENFMLMGNIAISGVRTIKLPTDQDMLVIAGASPRFQDKMCIHELVAVLPT